MTPTADISVVAPPSPVVIPPARGRPLHLPGTDTAEIVATRQIKKVRMGLSAIAQHGGVVTIDGKPGLGKTFAGDLMHQQLDLPRYWVTMPYQPKGKETLARLHAALTGHRTRMRGTTEYELLEDIKDILAERQVVIAVDEAQHLTASSLHQLRYLFDNYENRLVLMLIGTDIIKSLIRNCPQLENRSSSRVQFTRYRRSEMVPYLAKYHPLYANSSADAVNIIVDAANGNLRNAANLLKTALALQISPDRGMTASDAKSVVHFVQGEPS